MSSLRNSLHRRNHKERSQLANRARLGILEKHKDYVLRARDYHSKQDRIHRLKQKAADRNKDEFYFGMNNQRTQGGVHLQSRGNIALPADITKILKTQDENYVRTMRAANSKKVDSLKTQLLNLLPGPSQDVATEEGVADLDKEELEILQKAGIITHKGSLRRKNPRKHLVFVDDEQEATKYVESHKTRNKSDAPESNTEEELDVDLGWKVPSSSKKRQQTQEPVNKSSPKAPSPEDREEAKKHRHALLQELSARLTRDTQLRYAERELEMQRLLMGKGARRKISGVERVDGGKDEDDRVDEDAMDDPRSRAGMKSVQKIVDEKTYKPRVYKWKAERKR